MKPILFTLMLAVTAGAMNVHVSPAGNDSSPGTAEESLRTLEAARDKLRTRVSGEPGTVWLADGRYELARSFVLGAGDSGTEGAPVIYRAVHPGKASICGSVGLPADGWKAADGAAAKRLPKDVADKVRVLDLKALGFEDYGKMLGRGFSKAVWPMQMELFADETRMTLARWPQREGNTVYSGKVKYGKVTQVGTRSRYGETGDTPGKVIFDNPRIKRWADVEDVWVHGVWAYDWADRGMRLLDVDLEKKELTLEHSHYGFKANKPFYVYNLLEELDTPGEYYIDRSKGLLYFYQPENVENLRVTTLGEPLVVLENASHVILQDLTIEECRSQGVALSGGSHNRIRGCTLRNLGTAAINIGEGEKGREIYNIGYGGGMDGLYANTAWNRHGGTDNGVENCHIHDIAAYGVMLGGGDRKTLTPAGNFVVNCDIHDVAQIYEQMFPNVHIDGVGNRVAHNRLTRNPHSVIMLWGNNHVMEYNDISHCVYDSSDSGAIYIGRDPSQTGNIYRWNYFHHIKGHEDYEGIFFDDGASGQIVYGNIFHGIGSRGATKYHGGQFNIFVNNIVVDCSVPVGYQLWDQAKWQQSLNSEQWQKRLLEAVNILEPPYSTQYPTLAAVFETPYSRESHVEERNWVTTAADPLFENGAVGDFRVRDWDALRKKVSGFQIVPVDRIGLPGNKRPLLAPSFASTNKRLFPGQELTLAPAKADEARGAIEIRYTLDGSEPTRKSPLYCKPLVLEKPMTVKARAWLASDTELPGSGVSQRSCEAATGTIYLDEIAPAEFQAHNGLKVNHNYSYTGYVQMKDQIFEHSVMACPTSKERNSMVIYDLSIFSGRKRFEAHVGIDRLSKRGGSSAFQLYADSGDGSWKLLEKTPVLHSGQPAVKIEADLGTSTRIKLMATDGGNGTSGDHAAWGGAKIIVE